MTTKGLVYKDFELTPQYLGYEHLMGSLLIFNKEEYAIACYKKDNQYLLVFEKLLRMEESKPIWELLDTVRLVAKNSNEWRIDAQTECQSMTDSTLQFVSVFKDDILTDTFKAEKAWKFDFINRKMIPISTIDIECIAEEGCGSEE